MSEYDFCLGQVAPYVCVPLRLLLMSECDFSLCLVAPYVGVRLRLLFKSDSCFCQFPICNSVNVGFDSVDV